MTAKQLKEWANHLINIANKCDDPIVKAFILGKADTVGLEYLGRKDGDEDFRDLLLTVCSDYYEQYYQFMDKYL